MPLPTCPDCGSYDLDLRELLEDTRRHLICLECGHDWLHGEAVVKPEPFNSFRHARERFPTTDAVAAGTRSRAEELKDKFLSNQPVPSEAVAPYWAKYQQVFSAEGLPRCNPQDLKDFANITTGAHPGNMSVFNTAWNELGAADAAEKVRESIEYLLRGPDAVAEEDRLTHLIRGERGLGMKGFRESLLTKVLCVVYPERFVPILVYTGTAGKREIAEKVYGLRMPSPEAVSWTPGRLAVWSNDLLRELAGPGFVDNVHLAEFLWWAKDEVSATT
jgi:hypothetical protein